MFGELFERVPMRRFGLSLVRPRLYVHIIIGIVTVLSGEKRFRTGKPPTAWVSTVRSAGAALPAAGFRSMVEAQSYPTGMTGCS